MSYADDAAATAAPAASEPAGPAPIPLAMDGFSAIGLKPTMDDLRLNVYGWVEASYTGVMDPSKNNTNVGRIFDYRGSGFLFNQSSLNIERTLADGKDFDIGGKFEAIYGTDSRFIHSYGLVQNYSGSGENPQTGNPFQNEEPAIDPTVFYLQARLPIGEGLNIKGGRFVTPMGVEVIDATGNALYSHSFSFNYAIPLTHTGVEADYNFTDKLNVAGYVVLGWDDLHDDNKVPSYMGTITYKFTDKITNALTAITGPERPHNDGDFRTVVDDVFTWQVTDPLSLTFGGDIGNETGTDFPGNRGDSWYGLVAYATYTLIPSQLNATIRAEYFVDETGTRVSGSAGAPVDLYEVTGGLDIHPLKDFLNLRIRPEIRYDRASHAIFDTNALGVGQIKDQITAAADLIITY